ncbi:hypothetical protein R69927_07831 [Paraburkholderia domus]|nr:hypothetical protein R69927_07831 [Paraburkholderia domus]
MIRREPVHPERRDHVAIPRTPERQRINERLAHDHFTAGNQRHLVPHTGKRQRQIQVLRLTRRNLVTRRNPSPVHLSDVDHPVTRFQIEHRHHQTPVQVLVSALAIHAHALQLRAHVTAFLRVPRRQPVRQALVRIAQPERIDQLTMHQPALHQIRLRLRALLQGRVIRVGHLAQQHRFIRTRS